MNEIVWLLEFVSLQYWNFAFAFLLSFDVLYFEWGSIDNFT